MSDILFYRLYLDGMENCFAYSLDKKEIKNFLKYRNKEKFYRDTIYLSPEYAKRFILENGKAKIMPYTFKLKSGEKFDILLTIEEINYLNYASTVEYLLVANSTITPNIFRKPIFSALERIGYIKYWMNWKYGVTMEKKDSFELFVYYAMDTLDLEKILEKIM